MNRSNEEIKLLDIQIWSTWGFIIVSLISIILTHNQKLKSLKKKTIFSDDQKRILIIFNRLLSLLLVILFLYVNYKTYTIAKDKHERESIELEQLVAAVITLIAALFTMDATFKDLKGEEINNPLAGIENPTL